MEETVSIPTPDQVTLDFELAGLGSRFSAYLIDTLWIFAMIVIVAIAMFLSGMVGVRFVARALKAGSWLASSHMALLILLVFLIYWGYYVFFEGLKHGSTPGKKRLGIRVIRQDGSCATGELAAGGDFASRNHFGASNRIDRAVHRAPP